MLRSAIRRSKYHADASSLALVPRRALVNTSIDEPLLAGVPDERTGGADEPGASGGPGRAEPASREEPAVKASREETV